MGRTIETGSSALKGIEIGLGSLVEMGTWTAMDNWAERGISIEMDS